MALICPAGYPVIDPKMDCYAYDLFAYHRKDVRLPLCFYLEFASRLVSGENVGARNTTETPVGILLLPLLTIHVSSSFYVIVIIDVVYDLMIKRKAIPEVSHDGLPENPNVEDIFPTPGLDIYLAISGDFEKENPRASTWFHYLLACFKTVPAWAPPVLAFILYVIDKMSQSKNRYKGEYFKSAGSDKK
ncbi:MAG: hypothetical protein FWF88_00960 [Peptococcaceae bacterium]|nr:hypothetical protein [Peptococcaceae bacterium]